MVAEAGQWWHALLANDEATVCEAVNTAFSDNPAAGCAVGVEGSVLSVVMRQQDLDTMPTQTAGLTSSGRPTLKNLTKRDRTLWWLTAMGSNIVATLKEGFATAPGIEAIDLAVMTRLPDTQRLGFVAYGRWTRRAVESTPWRGPEDALRFLDIGQDTACSVTTTVSGNLSSTLKPLDTTRIAGLQALLDGAQDDSAVGEPSLADLDITLGANTPPDSRAAAGDPYRIRAFAEWKQQTLPPSPPAPSALPATPVVLVPGQTLVLPEEAWQGLVSPSHSPAQMQTSRCSCSGTTAGSAMTRTSSSTTNPPPPTEAHVSSANSRRDYKRWNAPPSTFPPCPTGCTGSPSPSTWTSRPD